MKILKNSKYPNVQSTLSTEDPLSWCGILSDLGWVKVTYCLE